jgi:DNA polymerase-3 subunit epsilon
LFFRLGSEFLIDSNMSIEIFNENLNELNFTAIDFETANEKRASICSMGLVVVRKGVIIREDHFLVKPKEMRFTDINSRIHGITPEDVKDAHEFNMLWEHLSGMFEQEIVLAHNANFDIDALRQTLSAYDIEHPDIRYICTQKLAQEAFSDLNNYRLSDVADHIGIELDHHNSLSDARAAATIGIMTLPLLKHIFYFSEYEEFTHHIAKKNSGGRKDSFGYEGKHIASDLLKPNLAGASSDNPFYNKKVVFTGDLQTIERKDAAAKIRAMGADINVAISKQTQIVIIGQKAGPSKMKKIVELKAAGYDIKIIEETEFLSLIQ